MPEYQGCGIGTKLVTYISKLESCDGHQIYLTSSSPSIIYSLEKNKDWQLLRHGHVKSSYSHITDINLQATLSKKRVTGSFKYIGGLNGKGKFKYKD